MVFGEKGKKCFMNIARKPDSVVGNDLSNALTL